ncbi:MAG: hypothetical protein AAFW87_05105 [Pseudomonadota bacterium]
MTRNWHALWTAIGLIFFANSALAQTVPNPVDLTDRIESGLRAIWPKEEFAITLDGCALFVLQISPPSGVQVSQTNLWLGDLDFRPEQVHRTGQKMGDGTGRTWWQYQFVYRWSEDTLAAHSDAIDNWRADYIGMLNRPGEVNMLEIEMRGLLRQMKTGAYGPFFQRNYAWAEGKDVFGDPFWEVNELVSETRFSPFWMVLNEDVADGLINDIALYAQATCKPAK